MSERDPEAAVVLPNPYTSEDPILQDQEDDRA